MLPNTLHRELLTNAEMAEADRLTIASSTPGSALMEQAGAAVASEAASLIPRNSRIAVFCGPGNNGGDGFVAARVLAHQEFTVELGLLGALDRLRGDAAFAAKSWTGRILAVEELDLESADLAIDALFGAGLARDLDGHNPNTHATPTADVVEDTDNYQFSFEMAGLKKDSVDVRVEDGLVKRARTGGGRAGDRDAIGDRDAVDR